MAIDPITWLVDNVLQARDARKKISVLVHEAFKQGDPVAYYFIKITNLSQQNTFTITHIFIKDSEGEIDVINPERTLPCKLESSEQWETWFPKTFISDQENIFKNFRVVLSDGSVYKSKKNNNVRPRGYIAG